MSTGETHIGEMEIVRYAVNTSFESIDKAVRSLDMEAFVKASTLPAAKDRLIRLLVIFDSIRPLLRALASVPLLPEQWRKALQLLIAVLDELSASTPKPFFKAGKDL